MTPRWLLVVFTRYPEPGQAKTRLIPALGAHAAAQLHKEMTQFTLEQAQTFLALEPEAELRIAYHGGSLEAMQAWLGEDCPLEIQAPGDLGNKMRMAIHNGLTEGFHGVAIIGTDCPDLTPALLQEAFEHLGTKDLVLGPSKDGGYYLIGASEDFPQLFEDMPWGTDQVLDQTIRRARGLSLHYLPHLQDVDLPQDLPLWQARQTNWRKA